MGVKIAESVRRSPYLWAAIAILGLLALNGALARIAKAPGDGSNALAVVALVVLVLPILGWLQLRKPKAFIPRNRQVLVRWAYSISPFLFVFCAVAAGGEQWVVIPGFVESVVLVVLSARITRREETANAS